MARRHANEAWTPGASLPCRRTLQTQAGSTALRRRGQAAQAALAGAMVLLVRRWPGNCQGTASLRATRPPHPPPPRPRAACRSWPARSSVGSRLGRRPRCGDARAARQPPRALPLLCGAATPRRPPPRARAPPGCAGTLPRAVARAQTLPPNPQAQRRHQSTLVASTEPCSRCPRRSRHRHPGPMGACRRGQRWPRAWWTAAPGRVTQLPPGHVWLRAATSAAPSTSSAARSEAGAASLRTGLHARPVLAGSCWTDRVSGAPRAASVAAAGFATRTCR
eukprot:363048-Chlamydomonas_euryale.AAC.5